MPENTKILEAIEEQKLKPYAVLSKNSKGRIFAEEKDLNRLCFQKDKERIIHSKAFRRLDKKTQVFITGTGDHFRTRLTHTLEVAQISRDVARRMGLNEDLCEAIALAHDLGHPPFGHGGEDALNEIMKKYGLNFEHNEQSLLIVESIEKSYPNFDGLNLSIEVLDGLKKHQTAWDQKNKSFNIFPHLEAQVVNISDEIAYSNHDIDDGIRSGILKFSDFEKLEIWKNAVAEVEKKYGKIFDKEVLISRVISQIMSLMIDDLCKNSEENLKKNMASLQQIPTLICFSPKMIEMISKLRVLLYNKFYLDKRIVKFINEGKLKIKKLFEFYLKNKKKFPQKTNIIPTGDPEINSGRQITGENSNTSSGRPSFAYGYGRHASAGLQNDADIEFVLSVKNYIAGMTDAFLIKEYERLIMKKNN
ncbi:MAG: dNTP triphosphohydrolase [Candidatus Gracilibacteria bacterium]|jgi:dGTPase